MMSCGVPSLFESSLLSNNTKPNMYEYEDKKRHTKTTVISALRLVLIQMLF